MPKKGSFRAAPFVTAVHGVNTPLDPKTYALLSDRAKRSNIGRGRVARRILEAVLVDDDQMAKLFGPPPVAESHH